MLDNDSDPNGDSIRLVSVSDPGGCGVGVTCARIVGNAIEWIPPSAGFVQDALTFDYRIRDSGNASGTATVTVNVAQLPSPRGEFPSFFTVSGAEVGGNVAASDLFGPFDSVRLVTQPENGTIMMKGNGDFTYTAPADFAGVARFEYEVANAAGSAIGRESIFVREPQAPAANDDLFSINEDSTLVVTQEQFMQNDILGPPISPSPSLSVSMARVSRKMAQLCLLRPATRMAHSNSLTLWRASSAYQTRA